MEKKLKGVERRRVEEEEWKRRDEEEELWKRGGEKRED